MLTGRSAELQGFLLLLQLEMTNLLKVTNANYPDLIITQCINASNYHILPHKYVQLLCQFFSV